MNTKAIITFVAITLGILLGSVALLWKFGNAGPTVIADVAGEMKHSKGEGQITVVEYSDFQCPACKAVQEPLAKLLAKNEGKVKFVYRHFPLTTIHKNAQLAAQASEAAAIQNKFWEMHDILFLNQTEWEKENNPAGKFAEYAEKIGINKDQFANDLNSQPVKDAVNTDNLAATRYRLTGTPTFFVNGEMVEFGAIQSKLDSLAQ